MSQTKKHTPIIDSNRDKYLQDILLEEDSEFLNFNKNEIGEYNDAELFHIF
jgi:hypothetical protein